jgi:isopentenyl phosphate kinase
LKPARVILAGHVDGVFTADPLRETGSRLLSEVSISTLSGVEEMLTGSFDIDVTGGMLSKVRTMCQLIQVQPTITVRIISGRKDGLIKRTLIDPGVDEGTLLHW